MPTSDALRRRVASIPQSGAMTNALKPLAKPRIGRSRSLQGVECMRCPKPFKGRCRNTRSISRKHGLHRLRPKARYAESVQNGVLREQRVGDDRSCDPPKLMCHDCQGYHTSGQTRVKDAREQDEINMLRARAEAKCSRKCSPSRARNVGLVAESEWFPSNQRASARLPTRLGGRNKLANICRRWNLSDLSAAWPRRCRVDHCPQISSCTG